MTAPDAVPPAVPSPHSHHWRRGLVLVLAGLVLIAALYTWVTVHWDYSSGNRSGLLQKFSRKGWLCKTHEGELWQSVVNNVAPTIWYFTVRDDRVAATLDTLVGRQVRLHYSEHRGVPSSCFGDTRYYVDQVVVVGGEK
jgi:hypothetical protein